MHSPKKPAKNPGFNIYLSKRQKRRLEKKPPAGMSLKKWRKQKPKKPIPTLGRKQKPIENVLQAKTRIATVMRLYRGGRERFAHFTALLSAAYAAKKPDKKAIAEIEKARGKIALNRIVEKNPWPVENLSKITNLHLESFKSQFAKQKFGVCQKLIHVLAEDTPKSESRIVANFLEQTALDALKIIETEPNALKGKACFELSFKLYAAAEHLYENVSNKQGANRVRKNLKILQKWQLKLF